MNSDEKQFYKLGASTVSITPKAGVDLYALDGLLRKSDEIHSELTANVITIGFHKDLLIIVSLDLVWVDRVFTKKIQKWVNTEYSNYNIQLFLVATHSHSTPQISERICNSARPDKSYLIFLYDQTCQAIEIALNNKEQCHAELSITHPNLMVNRRKKILSLSSLKKGIFKTIVANRPNQQGLRDDSLYALWFYDSKDNEKAVLLNYACHPTLFRKNAVSADFPGVVSQQLKNQLSKELVVCFLQGFTGNIKANITYSSCVRYKRVLPYIYNCLFDRVKFNKNVSSKQLKDFSIKLAEFSLERDNAKYINPQIFFKSKTIELPLQSEKDDKHANLEITYASIGDSLKIITIGGEVFNEYSLWLRKFLSFNGINVLTVGYCNGMVGYIPTYDAIQEGGYEVERALKEFALPLPFSDKIESILKEEIKKIIRESFL